MSLTSDKYHILTPNVPRIIAALYKSMQLAAERGKPVSQYDLVKTLFLADREHLNTWGRPITFDNYKAMKHGPVPTLAYDFLKRNEKAMRDHKVSDLPWTSQRVEHGSGKRHFTANASYSADEYLSESDIEALQDALNIVQKLGFSQIRRLTHQDPAYVEAWEEGGDRRSYDMKLSLLFENPDLDRAELLVEQSPYV